MKKFILCVTAILQFIVLFGHTNAYIPTFKGTNKSEISSPPTVMGFIYLNFNSVPASGGNLVGTELLYDPISGTGIGTYDANNGIEKEVTANTNPGYKFAFWTYSGTDDKIIADDSGYTLDNIFFFHPRKLDRFDFDAHFNLIVTARPNIVSGGTVSGTGDFDALAGSGDYAPGSNVTLSATPTANWEFVSWTDVSTGLVVSTDANYTFTVNGPDNLVANFRIISFNITTTSNPNSGGSSSGAGTYNIGTPVLLTATPASGYIFVNWTEGATVISNSLSFSITADRDYNLQANFIQQFIVTVFPFPSAGGSTTPTGSDIYNAGTIVPLMATPATGYRFVNWTEGGLVVSTIPGFSITADKDRTLRANFIKQFNIGVVSNPTTGGSTTGSGIYDINTNVTLTATPSIGFRFVNWTEDGTVVSASASYGFSAVKDRNLQANFVQKFTISASAITGGSATGSGIYDDGATASLSASPLAGFAFLNWTEAGTVVSTNSGYSFTVDKDRTLVANFIPKYNIAVTGNTGGSASGSGNYNSGTVVALTATPLAGYVFVNWTEDGIAVSTDPSYSFTADKDRTLLANFIQKFTITASATPGGSATGSGLYDAGTSVGLSATALTGYAFENWTEGGVVVSTDPAFSFSADRARTLVANFIQRFTINANSSPGGSATGTGVYDAGTSVALSATTLTGFAFVNWTESGIVVSSVPSFSFTADKDRTLVAKFIQQFNVAASASAGGSVTGTGVYDAGTSVVVTATPSTGYAFLNWTEDGVEVSNDPSLSFTAEKDRTLVANFIQRFAITAISTLGGSATGTGVYDAGVSVSLSATALTGYTFVNWTEGGIVVSTDPLLSIIAEKDRTLQANFIQRFDISTNSTAGGSATGTGIYDAGSSVAASATALTGFAFVNWTEGGVVVSSNSSYSFSADKDRTLVANFIQQFTINANSTAGGSTSGTGVYEAGSNAIVSATALTGYTFVNWTEGGIVVSTDPSYSFTADKDRTLQANFIQKFTITASATTGGSATGTGVYDAGVSVVVTAAPSTGYAFLNWTEDGIVVSTDPLLSFIADKDRTLQANFIQRFNVAINSTEGGSASGAGVYDSGASVIVIAAPSAGYIFANWTEDGIAVSTDPSYSFTADKDRTLVANFIQQFTINANSTAGGSTTGTGVYEAGSNALVSATALTGYAFVNWTEGGITVSSDPSYSFTTDRNRTLVANFNQQFTINAISTPGGSASGTGIYDAGVSVVVTATPSTGYVFLNWTEGGVVVSNDPSLSFTAEKDRTLAANFIQRFTITAISTPGGSATGTGVYDAGVSVSISAAALTGNAFVNWTEGGVVVSTDPSLSFIADKDRTLQANFIQRFDITTNSSAGGSATGTGIYDAGTSVAASATALTGFAFVNWTEGGVVVSSDPSYSFSADKERTLVANFIQRFTITANSTAGGSVTGTGVYDAGSSVVVSATALTGYAFVNWTEGVDVVSTDPSLTFTADKDKTLVANFIHRFNIVANSTTGGSTAGTGVYDAGTTVSVSATPTTGYAFVNWTEGGIVVSSDPSYSFTADEDRTLVANFIQQFTITANSTTGGSTTGTGVYDAGIGVTLSATALTGYAFINWTESGIVVSSDPSFSFTADKDRTLLANFIQRYNITANSTTGGSASGTGVYVARSGVAVYASASMGYVFVNWTEGGVVVSSDPSYSFSADRDRTLVANFIQQFNVAASASAGGVVSGTGIYNAGTSVALSAIALTGYAFVNWTEDGAAVSNDPSYIFTADKDRTLVANFIQRFTITANSTSGGSATGNGIYNAGNSVALSAIALTGYAFVNWTEGGVIVSTDPSFSFTADNDRTLIANFIQRFTITANSTPGGSASGTGVYDAGTSVALSATTLTGFAFVNWTESGIVVSSVPSFSFTADKDRTLVAKFIQQFNVAASASAGGSVTGTGVYDAGTSVVVTATPSTGYAFLNWTEDGVVVSTDPSFSFSANKDRTLVANFIQRFTITANSTAGGSALGTGVYDAGTSVTLSEIALTGYAFVNWTESGIVVSTNQSYSLTVDKDRSLLANFIQRFNISANSTEGGSVTGTGVYDAGASATLTATPLTGYAFLNWTEDGVVISTNPMLTFEVDATRTFQANFIQRFAITANSTTGGSAFGTGVYDAGAGVILSVSALTGYVFVNWTEDGAAVSTDPSYTFTANKDRTLQANFNQQFNIAANSTVGGSTSGTGVYNAGANVTLSATALTGYVFVNWTSGGVVFSTNPIYSFISDQDRNLQANFIQRFNITANYTAGGSATGTGVYNAGASVLLSATALSGYAFVNWTEIGVVVSTNTFLSFTANKDRTLQANFIQRFDIEANATTGGSTSGPGVYNTGSSVSLTAIPLTGYAFLNWTENGTVVSTNPSLSLIADKDRTLLANFIQRFTITANAQAGGLASGSGIYDTGTSVSLTATPLADWLFVNWTENGTIVSTTPVFSITAVKDRTLQANFKLKTFKIMASVVPSGSGTISDDLNIAAATFNKTYSVGDNVKLTAVPTTGFDFVNWTEDGTDLNVTTPVYTFSVNKDRVLKANFTRKIYTIKAYAYPSDGGLISKTGSAGGSASFSGTYAHGDEVKLSASQSACYEFVNWSETNAIVSLNTNYSFIATSNRTLIVNFASPAPLKIKSSDSICMGEAMNFELISDKLKNNLIWDFGDGKTATGPSVSHTFGSTGYFKVSAKSTDPTLCLANIYKMIKVYTTTLNLNLKDTIACSPFHLSLSASSKNDKLLWNFGDDNTWYSKCDKVYVNKDDKPVRRKVTVISNNDHGCNTTSSFYVTINPSPKSGIEYYTKPGRPEILVYKNTSVLSDSCEWDLPDGTREFNKDSIIQQFKQNGFYRILLKSSNKYGCTDTTSVSHRTLLTGLYVPNAFRPESQDHKVNCFKPIGTGLKSCDMSIYDLWGNLVWQAKCDDDLESFEGWNGKSKNGTPLPVGVYIWRIWAVFQDGTEWKGNPDEKGKCRTEGNITILR